MTEHDTLNRTANIAQRTYGALIETGAVTASGDNFAVTRQVAQAAKSFPNSSPEEWREFAVETTGISTPETRFLMSAVTFALWRSQGEAHV